MMLGMARPVVHDAALRDRLMDAATSAIERDGAEGLVLRELAAECGTSTSAVYALFGGKPQLLAAGVAHALASFGSAQRDAAPQGLRALGIAYRAWALTHPTLYGMMFGSASTSAQATCTPDGQPDVGELAMVPLREAVAAAQRAGVMTDVPLEIAAAAIWGQVHGLVSLQLAGISPTGLDWDAAYDCVLDTVARSWSAPAGGVE